MSLGPHNFFLLGKCATLVCSGFVPWNITSSSATTTHANVVMKVKVILTHGRVCAKANVYLLFQSQCKEARAPAELHAGPEFPKYLIACRLSIDVCAVWSSLSVYAAQSMLLV